MKDYPAAHSADTLWFAIDECGHVVACYSNESGAIPMGAVTNLESENEDSGPVNWEAEDRFALETIAPSHVHHLAETFVGKHKDKKYGFGGLFHILSEYPKEIEDCLVGIKTPPQNRPIVREICASKETGGKKYYLLMTFDRDDLVYEEVHRLGICVACTVAYTIRAGRVGPKGEAVPYYDHPSANGNAYPYMLQYVPEKLKTIDELVLSEGDKKGLREGPIFGGCFLKKPFLQPAEEVESELYGEEYTPIEVNSEEFKGLFPGGVLGYW